VINLNVLSLLKEKGYMTREELLKLLRNNSRLREFFFTNKDVKVLRFSVGRTNSKVRYGSYDLYNGLAVKTIYYIEENDKLLDFLSQYIVKSLSKGGRRTLTYRLREFGFSTKFILKLYQRLGFEAKHLQNLSKPKGRKQRTSSIDLSLEDIEAYE